VGAQVEGGGAHPLPILDRGADSLGKGGGDLGVTLAAAALLGAVLGDFQPDGGKLEDLPAFAMLGGEFPVVGLAHRRAALRATVLFAEAVFDEVIGLGDALEGLTVSAFLAARLAPGLAPQALGLGRVGEVARVRGGRLAAGARVALQCGEFSLEALDFRLQSPGPPEEFEAHFADGFGIDLGQLDEFLFAWGILLHKREIRL